MDKSTEWEATKLEYAQPNSMVDIGEMYWWADYWHKQARARVGKVDDMYTNSPVSIPIEETCIQSVQAKPVEVGELAEFLLNHYTENKFDGNLDRGCSPQNTAQAILNKYDVTEK